jgi:RNA 3'-terminal phosphate cyclase
MWCHLNDNNIQYNCCSVTATTSTGCLLASSGLVERGAKAEVVAASIVAKFQAELSHGGCTDEYLQVIHCGRTHF